MSLKVLTFGAILWDIIEDQEYIGGAPFNFAAHMARLGNNSQLLTSVGDDKRGKLAIEEIQKQGVDAALVRIDPQHPTGTVDVELTDGGSPSYVLHENVAYDYVELTESDLLKLKNLKPDVFYFGTYEQRSPVNVHSLQQLLKTIDAKHIFLDVNLRQHYYTREVLISSLSACTILKLNDEEVKVISSLLYDKELTDEAFSVKISHQYSIELVCVTRGANGCAAYNKGQWQESPGITVQVADTVGAGDAFSAALVSHYCQKGELAESMSLANRLGAFVASKSGALPEYDGEISQLVQALRRD